MITIVQQILKSIEDHSSDNAFCIEDAVNTATGKNDHSPARDIESSECVYVPHEPRSAIVYQNNPRIFNGMMNSIPENSIRETLWLNYQ